MACLITRRWSDVQLRSAGSARRIPVAKTPKAYVGGEFIRSESGRVFPVYQPEDGGNGERVLLANIPQCTRKDVRNAVEAAAKAGPQWAGRTPYHRGQIIYRLAEMLESRSAEMAGAIASSGGGTCDAAAVEVSLSVDRLVYYAGWADKYEQILGNTNPVAGPFFNFTVAEPMGVVGVIADDASPLLALISQVAPIIVSGNTAVTLASETLPYPAILLGEMLATSDLPGGVVNILTGLKAELIATFATHTHIRGVDAIILSEHRKELALGAAESVKRLRVRPQEDAPHWSDESTQSVYDIRAFVEFKTTWHPIGA
ncbi:MAG: aldehyde dehydrogenase family protein [Acidobacteria bacterium]|nr:aldehyde dehydrogenase family protein [Acidobacteriota bacterium]